MGNNATRVTTGKPKVSGSVYVAPIGTTLPTDATTELPSAFVGLGYVSEDGLENSTDMSISTIKEWGGLIVYNSLDELTDQFKLTLIEAENIDVLKTVYGDDHVTTAADGTIHIEATADDPQERVYVFELALRNGLAKRIVVPDGAITARDAITYTASDAVGYAITISAYPDANGKTHDEYQEAISNPSA